jgi:hypothetical protein
VLASANDLVGGLEKRKVRVVGHHGLREGRELHALLAKLVDLAHDLVDGSLAAIEDRTQLHRGGFTTLMPDLLFRLGEGSLAAKCSAMGVPANFSRSRRAKSSSEVRGR